MLTFAFTNLYFDLVSWTKRDIRQEKITDDTEYNNTLVTI